MIKEYFHLQFKMMNRKLRSLGLHPLAAYLLVIAAFAGLSIYLFSVTHYAEYIYILIGLSIISRLSNKERNDFLKFTFPNHSYYKLRFLENSLSVLPFLTFLVLKTEFFPALSLAISACMMALINFNNHFQYTLQTPFHKRPFEFTVGFRNTFFMFPLTWFLVYMSVSVDNFNLGVFSLILIYLTSFTYYLKPEKEYYIWIFNKSSISFLAMKVKTGILQMTLLTLPVLIPLGIFFQGELGTILIIQALGYIYLLAIILAKYSSYPEEISVPRSILVALSLVFPPFLLGVIPYFFYQSTNKLKPITG